MERTFDFGALFKTHDKKHKNRPTNFVSVAGGIQKRLESSIKNRKSTRLTAFDTVRKLPECPSPAPMSEAQKKMEHRRQQLEKWKMEKEQKKKELAAQKKKPFITGVARNPMKFVPPPPPPKPSTSGRVTRSMARATLKPVKPSPKSRTTQSFAPKNATFKPPELKNLVKLPKLAPPSKTKSKKDITFEPVVHTSTTAKQSRTRPPLTRQNASETKPSSRVTTETRNTRSKVKKPSPKKPLQSSSSSSDMEPAKLKNKTPKKSVREPKQLTPKVLAMQSSSDDKFSSESSNEKPKRKSLRSTYAVKDSESSTNKTSTDMEASCDERVTTITKLRKSLPKNYSPQPFPSTSSSDRISDVEDFDEKILAMKSRRSLHSPRPLPSTSSSDRISDVEDIDEKILAMKSRKSLLATPRIGIPKSESSSEEKLRSPKSPIELALTPEKIEDAKNTPSVTMSRGKDNARKEAIWKMKEGLLDADASDSESVEHFRKQLASEVTRISDMCNVWDKISEQAALPEFVQEAILAAVGQGRLLVSQKLQQFGSLVERCARPAPRAALVTPADLQGFWDMVFLQVTLVIPLTLVYTAHWSQEFIQIIQVTNVDLRFKKLEELRQRNWVEDAPVLVAKRAAPPAARAAKGGVKRTKPPAGPSRIQQMIAEKRKAIKQQEQSQPPVLPPAEGEKTFEAGFFTVRSPVRSPVVPVTPNNKHNLLKAVLSSEAKKASKSPFAMLRASMLAKNAEHDGFAPLPQTPQMKSHPLATPGKSILKSANVDVRSANKPVKVVLFHPSDSETSDTFTLSDNIKSSDMFTTALDDDLIKFDNTVEIDKENSPSPVMKTKRQSKRLTYTETEITPRRSSRNKRVSSVVVEDVKTPTKVTSRKKQAGASNEVQVQQKTKRSTRKKSLQDDEGNVTQENIPTPKRSSRRNKLSAVIS